MLKEEKVDVLYTQAEIKAICNRLGKRLHDDYQNKNPLVIIVLRGASIFGSDLIRQMDINMNVDFITISSYGNETNSSGNIRVINDVDVKVTGRDVLLVDDILDTGQTMHYLKSWLRLRHPKSIKTCFLLDKPARRSVNEHGDYVGMTVPDKFIVGYGIDFAGRYRNLPYIGALNSTELENKQTSKN